MLDAALHSVDISSSFTNLCASVQTNYIISLLQDILYVSHLMQAHLTVMLLGIIIAFISLLLVLIHSEFTWLTTQVIMCVMTSLLLISVVT